jgi:hypothetical protein
MRNFLLRKNAKRFSHESFKVYMKAPCSRLLVKSVLKELGQREKYKELAIYKEPLWLLMKNNFKPIETKIYINGDFV